MQFVIPSGFFTRHRQHDFPVILASGHGVFPEFWLGLFAIQLVGVFDKLRLHFPWKVLEIDILPILISKSVRVVVGIVLRGESVFLRDPLGVFRGLVGSWGGQFTFFKAHSACPLQVVHEGLLWYFPAIF